MGNTFCGEQHVKCSSILTDGLQINYNYIYDRSGLNCDMLTHDEWVRIGGENKAEGIWTSTYVCSVDV